MFITKRDEWGEGVVGVAVEGPFEAHFASKGFGLLGKLMLGIMPPRDGNITIIPVAEVRLPTMEERYEQAAKKEYDKGLLPNAQTYEVMANTIRAHLAFKDRVASDLANDPAAEN